MSICINASAEDRRSLVIASDMMVSIFGGTFSADATTDKAGNLVPKRWGVLYAGDDITHVLPLITRAREELKDSPKPTQEQVSDAIRRSYQRERMALAVDKHLSIYGLSMEEFLANGMNTFGDVGYGVMRERIDQTTLDCSLLIGGFDQADRACIFSVEEPGTVHDFAGIGYWAIGSGALNALGRLSIRKQRSGLSIEQTIYNVYEAKIAAESAFGVGPTTNLFVVRPDGVAYTLGKEIPEAIREECKRNLTPTITPTLLRQVHDTAKIALAEVTEEARQALPETTHDQPGQLPSRE